MLAIACAGRGSDVPIGTSAKRAVARKGSDADGGFVDGATVLPSGYRTSFTKLNAAPFVSQGHAAGRWEVDLWANELAQRALASRAREVPVGAIVVAEHRERMPASDDANGKATGPTMLMEKKAPGFSKEHGDWRYVVVGSQGQLVRDGSVDSCAGCHDDAPMDGLFPLTP
jgi:hypothetical protein